MGQVVCTPRSEEGGMPWGRSFYSGGMAIQPWLGRACKGREREWRVERSIQ